MGVAVNSITGVTVEVGRGVAIIAEVLVGAIFVCVEEDIGIAVAGLVMDGKVSCGDDIGFNAAVDTRESEAVGAIVGVGDAALGRQKRCGSPRGRKRNCRLRCLSPAQ